MLGLILILIVILAIIGGALASYKKAAPNMVIFNQPIPVKETKGTGLQYK